MVDPIHASVKGRTRYRVKGLYRSHLLKSHLESQLRNEEGVTRVNASTLTGNLLIIYNSGRSPSDVAGLIQGIVSDYSRKAAKSRKSEHTPAARQDIASTGSKRRGNGRKKRPPMSKRKLRRLVVHSGDQPVEPWHVKEADDVLKAFATSSAAGLNAGEARQCLKKYGPNVLPEAIPRSGLSILLDQLRSVPVGMLTAAAGISILTGGVVDAVAIMGVVGINTVIGYVTESQSEKTIHSLKSLVRPRALVRRDEKVKEIGAEDVVPGDMLVLRPGQYVAADARLIEAKRLSIDESALTGESV
ncbi:MAG: ATPase, partial [Deltaproteobacteria bacterium]|nr:ATPase [Deltaproteobacteria bacterium]